MSISRPTVRAAADAPFLVAARGGLPSRRPVWIMRQAGRYLPEYRAVRQTRTFLQMCYDADAATEVTLQPIRRYGLDAAILFTDLLVPVPPMGIELAFDPAPVLKRTVRTRADVDALRVPDPERDFAPMLATAAQVRAALSPDVALIGFVGAPFTVACYLVEGKGSKNWDLARRLLHGEPATFDALLAKITDALLPLVQALADAGCDAVQVFDSWAGVLAAGDYVKRCAPWTERLLAAARQRGAIAIDYVNGATQHVAAMADSCAEVLAVDWRSDLGFFRRQVPATKALQGNLDPTALFASEADLRSQVRACCDAAGPAGHVFNLGHGVLPETDPDQVRIAVDEARRAWP
ncbi:MAG: uroporphyrinogen decarboxylase [Planctomycetes bacterium]|nr:uroporphyrinogen decarboxylase [Planctomycetota bacterium]